MPPCNIVHIHSLQGQIFFNYTQNVSWSIRKSRQLSLLTALSCPHNQQHTVLLINSTVLLIKQRLGNTFLFVMHQSVSLTDHWKCNHGGLSHLFPPYPPLYHSFIPSKKNNVEHLGPVKCMEMTLREWCFWIAIFTLIKKMFLSALKDHSTKLSDLESLYIKMKKFSLDECGSWPIANRHFQSSYLKPALYDSGRLLQSVKRASQRFKEK